MLVHFIENKTLDKCMPSHSSPCQLLLCFVKTPRWWDARDLELAVMVATRARVDAAQILNVPSAPHVTATPPRGENASAVTAPTCGWSASAVRRKVPSDSLN